MLIGIDPGKTGAVAWILAGELQIAKCPETIKGMAELFRGLAKQVMESTEKPPRLMQCRIERVHGGVYGAGIKCDTCGRQHSPAPVCPDCKQHPPLAGAASQFNFGKGYGAWLGVLETLGIDYEEILPRQWQKQFAPNLPKDKSAKKQAILELVNREYPETHIYKYAADAVAILHTLTKTTKNGSQYTPAPKKAAEALKTRSGQMELF